MEWTSASGCKVSLQQGDITKVAVDAMVNAANSALAGGGGVDGAIHRAGGPGIMRELDDIRRAQGGCPTGKAVCTSGGLLPAKFVFHAVGPVYRDGRHGEPGLLASCYRECLAMADERGVTSLSFPAISTGVYGYPLDEAAAIAVHEVKEYVERVNTSLRLVIFVLFDQHAMKAYAAVLQK